MEEIKKNLGQLIYDPYGRTVGRIVGLEVDANDNTNSIKLISDKGDYIELPMTQVKFQNNSIIYLQSWEQEANEILKQLRTLNKRINALDELYRSGEIREEFYQSLKSNYENSFTKIKDFREGIVKEMSERSQDLMKEINELQITFANNKMQHLSGEIGEQSFRACQDIIQRNIESASSEKNNIERISNDIMDIDKEKITQYNKNEYSTSEFSKTEEPEHETPKTEEYSTSEFSKTEEPEHETPKTEE
ncbi:MAG: CdvA-like protein, partial [Candidatus Bathyarchaeota archaeon]|nr:CdvA-like protein [Candidatus Bathyarchaeota archaeon]